MKRTCCRRATPERMWISVQEYDLRQKQWNVLEAGRWVEPADDLVTVLQQEYRYDKVKFYGAPFK